MEAYKNDESILVADVDCIGTGKSKCDEVGVKGFPTIKQLGNGCGRMLQNGHHGAGLKKNLYSPAQDFRLRHGDPNDLEDYKGGRDFDALKKFTELTGARAVGHGAWGDGMVGIVMAGTSGREPMDLQGVGSEGISLENPHRRGRRLWAPPVVPRTRISAIRTGHVLCSWKGGLGKKDWRIGFQGRADCAQCLQSPVSIPIATALVMGNRTRKRSLRSS